MPIKKNNKNYGTKVRIEEVEPSPLPEYFYVKNLKSKVNTLTITRATEVCPAIEVFKSTDQVNWESMGTTTVGTPLTADIPPLGKLYLKANTNRWWGNKHEQSNIINCAEAFEVGGNVMSLLNGDNFENTELTEDNAGAFAFLFSHSNVYVAGNLKFPSNVVNNCYNRMFVSCHLISIPELPATTLAESCYSGMFQYGGSNACPILPATTLVKNCYQTMFYASNVNGIVSYATDISASGCLDGWVYNVSGTGDFYNLGGATYPSGKSGIPTGWTEHTSL
jgi:hypothetical protein